ncbi:MAG: hypothetical protein AB7I38_14350 [Dehalococcoidia bacterium]
MTTIDPTALLLDCDRIDATHHADTRFIVLHTATMRALVAAYVAHQGCADALAAEIVWWQDIAAADNDDVTPEERAHALLVATRLSAITGEEP